MNSIKTATSSVHFSTHGFEVLNQKLKGGNYSILFILVDENTHENCLPYFMGNIEGDYTFEIVEIESGEVNKNLETCTQIWEVLSELGGDRKSALINLGGGVLTDMGGFIASCFKRGIHFYNVPTTLLSMVDASVGGKTGVDLGSLKNQIGVIIEPEMVLIDTHFLSTLDRRQLKSGFAEMLKHGLIADASYWELLKPMNQLGDISEHISQSVKIKAEVVQKDPREAGWRKILNFGHTLGHAIESHFLTLGESKLLLHGEAIAVGMILEAYLSHKYTGLSNESLEEITDTFIHHYGAVEIRPEDVKKSIELLKFDKKNSHGEIKFVLLEDIGKPVIDVVVSQEDIEHAFNYYKNEIP